MSEYRRFISAEMEAKWHSSAWSLEYIPEDDQLAERRFRAFGSDPSGNLSVLISYSKGDLKEALVGGLMCPEDGPVWPVELEDRVPRRSGEKVRARP